MSKKISSAVTGRSRLSCVVDNSVLGALIQVLTDHRVSQIKIDPVEGSESSSVPTMSAKKNTGGVRPVAETRMGKQLLLILDTHKGPPMTSGEIGAELAKHGFNKDSASPSLTRLVREGMVERTEIEPRRYVYTLAKT